MYELWLIVNHAGLDHAGLKFLIARSKSLDYLIRRDTIVLQPGSHTEIWYGERGEILERKRYV